MNKIIVTEKGQEIQNELRKYISQTSREGPENIFKMTGQLGQNDGPHHPQRKRVLLSGQLRALSLHNAQQQSIQIEEEKNMSAVTRYRYRSLAQRTQIQERNLEISFKLADSTLQNEQNGVFRNGSTSAIIKAMQQQQHNILDNLQRQQQKIYVKHIAMTKKQEQLQEKQKINYQRQMEYKNESLYENKEKDPFWKSWESVQYDLRQSAAQFSIAKESKLYRLDQFAKTKYSKSFSKLPRCAKLKPLEFPSEK